MPFYGENFSADARSERKKRYFHELEALLAEGNTDYRDAEDYAQHKIRESRLPAEEYEPEDIGYRMSIKIRVHYFADRRETCRAYLKALRAEGYADYRDTQNQPHEPPAAVAARNIHL